MGRIELASTDNLSINSANPNTAENFVAGIPTVDFRGDNLITYSAATNSQASKLGVTNTGTLEAQSGLVKISAKTASDVIDSVINLDGIIDVNAFDNNFYAGKVAISSTVGDINIGADIAANSAALNSFGGNVEITSTKAVNVNSNAVIKANGASESSFGNFIKITAQDIVFNGYVEAVYNDNHIQPAFILNQKGPNALKIRSGLAKAGDNNVIYETALENVLKNGTDTTILSDNSLSSDHSSGSVILENLVDNKLNIGKGDLTIISNAISFADKNDSIISTTGNVSLIAGSNGIDIGSILITRPENLDIYGVSGIFLYTSHNGDIKTHNLNVTNLNNNKTDTLISYIGVSSDGNLEINGDTNITAIGARYFAVSELEINAKNNILINGNINAISSVNNDIAANNFSPSNALVRITALGNIAINGDTNIQAKTTSKDFDISTKAQFSALAGAKIGPALESFIFKDATISNLSIAGNLNVNAFTNSSEITSGQAHVTTTASVQRWASGNVNVLGDTIVDAKTISSRTNTLSHTNSDQVTLAGFSAVVDNQGDLLNGSIKNNNFSLNNEGSINVLGNTNVTSSAIGITNPNSVASTSFNAFAASRDVKISGQLSTFAAAAALDTAQANADTRISGGMDAFLGSLLENSGNVTLTNGTSTIAYAAGNVANAASNLAINAQHDVDLGGDNSIKAASIGAPDVPDSSVNLNMDINAGNNILLAQDLEIELASTDPENISPTLNMSAGGDIYLSGYNEDGYDLAGFDKKGWNNADINKVTKTNYDINGFDRFGNRKPADNKVDKEIASIINSNTDFGSLTGIGRKNIAFENDAKAEATTNAGGSLSIQQLQNIEPGAGNAGADSACSAMNCKE